jgi:hypothetical protein
MVYFLQSMNENGSQLEILEIFGNYELNEEYDTLTPIHILNYVPSLRSLRMY